MGTPDYPASVKSFTTKQDGIDTVVASHVNALQDEVVALQSQVGVVSELPSLNLPSTSGTGAAVANRVGPQISGLKQWADHLNTYKAPLLSPTFEGTVTLPATTTIGTITSTELGYLDGVTSAIQTQLNGKVSLSGSSVITGALTVGANMNVNGILTHPGNFEINAQLGGYVKFMSGSVPTTIKIAQGVAADDAVRRDQLDYVWASAVNLFLSPNEEFYGNLRTLNGTFYQRHTNAYDKYSCVNIEHATNTYQPKSSSRTLKNDIAPLPAEVGAALFSTISPVSFVYKSIAENDQVPFDLAGTAHYGFIAEEVQDAGVPVDQMGSGIPALSLTDLVAVLWAKVQEQEQRIYDLTSGAEQ